MRGSRALSGVLGIRAFSVVLIVLSLEAVALTVSPSGVASTTTGYDIAYPQCNGSFPASPAFGIVGVNDGLPYSANPCLGSGDGPSELQWAGMNSGLYANTANPGPALSTHWPNGQTSPEQCNTSTNAGSDTAQCAYDYGWNAAGNSYSDAVAAYVSLGWAAAGATRTPVANAWWLDVESANSWTSNTAFNVQALQGEVDYLKSVGAASVGFYATASDWQTITGGTASFAAYQSWMPGASSLAGAQANCGGGGVTGGGIALTQYPSGGFDGDYRCAPPSPSLSFGAAPQTLTAGKPSGAMTVTIPQAASAATTVTLTSSSSTGTFETNLGGQWQPSVTVSIAQGATSSGSFYYSDTRAGQPVLTASASGYNNATQTEVVNPGALATIAISPTSAQVRVGGHTSFTATGRDGWGNAVSVTPSWSVSPALGSFSPSTGNPVSFAGQVVGNATITATAGGVSGTTPVTVTRKRSSQAADRSGLAAPRLTALIGGRCVAGRHLALRLRRGAGTELLAVRLLIDHKLVRTLRLHALATGLELRLPVGRHHVMTLVGLTTSGRRISAVYPYVECLGAAQQAQPPTLLPARPGG